MTVEVRVRVEARFEVRVRVRDAFGITARAGVRVTIRVDVMVKG